MKSNPPLPWKTIILSTVSTPGQSYGGLKKGVAKLANSLMGTLFQQLPQAQIGLKFKKICAHKIANDQCFWALKVSQKLIPSPRYEVLKFCAILWAFAPSFTLFLTTFTESQFPAHRKVKLAHFFAWKLIDGKGLILDFELWHFSFVPKNLILPHFLPLLETLIFWDIEYVWFFAFSKLCLF